MKRTYLFLFLVMVLSLPYIISSCVKRNQVVCEGFGESLKQLFPFNMGDSVIFVSDSGDMIYLKITDEHYTPAEPSYCSGKYSSKCDECYISGSRGGSFGFIKGNSSCLSNFDVTLYENTLDGKKDGKVAITVTVANGFFSNEKYQVLPSVQKLQADHIIYYDSLKIAGLFYPKILLTDYSLDSTYQRFVGCPLKVYYSLDQGLIAVTTGPNGTFIKKH